MLCGHCTAKPADPVEPVAQVSLFRPETRLAARSCWYALCPDRGPTIAVAVALVLGQLALALRSAKHTAADGAQPESTPKELQSSSKRLTEIRCQLPGVSRSESCRTGEQ